MSGFKKYKSGLVHVFLIILILGAASLIGYFLNMFHLPEADIAIVYMLAVLLCTLFFPNYIVGFIVSIVAAFAFNFLFIEPYFEFTANVPSYLITFIIMTITTFISSSLASHAKINERKAVEREIQTKALYQLTNLLTATSDMQEIAITASDVISSVICEKTGCLCFNEKGFPEKNFVQNISKNRHIHRKTRNPEELKKKITTLTSEFLEGDEFCDWPVYGQKNILGVIRLVRESALTLDKAKIGLLRSMVESIALAMDRIHSEQEKVRSQNETEQEIERSNLLRSISHDLRTPLSGILGSAEILKNTTDKESPKYAIIQGIDNDAKWLYSLVENVLSLTRLQNSKFSIYKQPEAVEEVLGEAVRFMSRRYPDYRIEVRSPEELFMIPMDVRLINQVLVNLIENAIKHTPPNGEIHILVYQDTDSKQAVFSIKDTGEGINPSDIPNIFQMFYTSNASGSDSRRGIGLGLTICQTIIKAHGGTIYAKNREDRTGAEFVFTLPLKEEKSESL